MTRIEFNLNTTDSVELEQKLKRVNKEIEEDLNKYLRSSGSKEVIQNVIGFMPKSKKNNKRHAKDSKSVITGKKINLGLEVRTAKKYGYLVFPEYGIGYKNLIAKKFFEKGLEKSKDKILNDVLNIIDNKLD